ncbi:kinesin motor domain-containing protein [Colletotrichum filicis]|nr:kinesin motor domain-containing protein [Colletotrichum filicis]
MPETFDALLTGLSGLAGVLTSDLEAANMRETEAEVRGEHCPPPTPRRALQRPSALPSAPDISSVNVSSDPDSDYAVGFSMYEMYADIL